MLKSKYLLNKNLSVPNEFVLRTAHDDRRQIKKKENANDIIYLGTKSNFIINISPFIGNDKIEDLYAQFLILKEVKGAMQKGTGICVKHNVDLNFLNKHIIPISQYLEDFSLLYKSPNFKKDIVKSKLEDYLSSSKILSFYSDIVFISDNPPKPYFKWFRDSLDGHSNDKLLLVKEFLIPKITEWNFKINSFENGLLDITWELSYPDTIFRSKNKKLKTNYNQTKKFIIEEILSKVLESDKEYLKTVKDAIVKVRLGQSKFRNSLLNSKRNNCVFTNIKTPKALLIAGHIKPWSSSSDKQRLDINNGILLTPTFDKLFDSFKISFDENGKLIYSSKINEDTWKELFPKFEDIKNTEIEITAENKSYFDFHRNKFNEENN